MEKLKLEQIRNEELYNQKMMYYKENSPIKSSPYIYSHTDRFEPEINPYSYKREHPVSRPIRSTHRESQYSKRSSRKYNYNDDIR